MHIAVGGRGGWPVRLVKEDPRFEAVALVDLNDEFLAQAREQLGLPESACFKDAKEALKQVECDALIICSPTTTHATYCRLGFEQGKHVLVEKGMTFEWEEAKALVKEAESAGVKFCVSQNYRFRPMIQAIKEIISDPSHPHYPGEPAIIDCMQHRYRPDPRTLTFPFSMIWDMAVHHFDNLIHLKGPMKWMRANAYSAPWSRYNHDANVNAFIEFADGAVCNFLLTHDGRFSESFMKLQGEKGVLTYGGVSGQPTQLTFNSLPDRRLRTGPGEVCEMSATERDVQQVVDAWHAYITQDEEPGISGRNNLETLAACEMVCRSASESRVVERAEL